MRSIALATLLAMLGAGALAEEPGSPGKPPKKPPPPPGIHWARDVEADMQRAAREGRPILFAVNALENERANNQLAGFAYRSAEWGEASRGYVAFVCNPNDHAAGEGACTRYPGHSCAGHKAALAWFLKRFGDELISPQHVILEPDGDVAYRKEYYTHVVSPVLLEAWLSQLAPNIAYARAAIGRESQSEALAARPLEELRAAACAWLESGDGLAAAAVTGVLEECFDDARRAALIAALARTPSMQAPVLSVAAEAAVLDPSAEPDITRAWLRTLFAVDRPTGVWAATRVLVRVESEAERDEVLRIWSGNSNEERKPSIDALPADERAAAYEALLLAGDRRGTVTRVPAAWTRGRQTEIARARRVRGQTTVRAVMLDEALRDAPPGRLRRALLDAPSEEVRAQGAAVRRALEGAGPFRVKVAAALALLRARDAGPDAAPITRLVLHALRDSLEARETRAAAVQILGADPGQSLGEWEKALEAHFERGAR